MLITLNEIGTVKPSLMIRKSEDLLVRGDWDEMMFEFDSPIPLHVMSTQIVRINEMIIPVFEWVKDKYKKRNWMIELFSEYRASGHYNKIKDVACTSVLMSNNKVFYVSESVDQIKDIVSRKNLKVLKG